MYIVTCDHPHYPYVLYCDTIEQANEEYEKAIEEIESKDGAHICKITIAKVIITLETRSDY